MNRAVGRTAGCRKKFHRVSIKTKSTGTIVQYSISILQLVIAVSNCTPILVASSKLALTMSESQHDGSTQNDALPPPEMTESSGMENGTELAQPEIPNGLASPAFNSAAQISKNLADPEKRAELVRLIEDVAAGNPPPGMSKDSVQFLVQQKAEIDAMEEKHLAGIQQMYDTFEKEIMEQFTQELDKIQQNEHAALEEARKKMSDTEQDMIAYTKELSEQVELLSKQKDDIIANIKASDEKTDSMQSNIEKIEESLSSLSAILERSTLMIEKEEQVDLLELPTPAVEQESE